MLFDLLLVLIVVRYIRKNLSPEELTPEWNRNLTVIFFTAIGLFVGDYVVSVASWVLELLSLCVTVILALIIFKKTEWKKIRPILNAMLPLIVIKVVAYIFEKLYPSLYNEYDTVFETAILFAFVWLAAMIAIGNKQRKALENEKLKVEEKEKEIRITEQLKATLEVQVKERTAELQQQKEELQQTVDELKATQAQLIQSEKMASLGELTAGIAHEIQNPLNFVNNFSEVSNELLVEMKEELEKGNYDEAKEIANDVIQNLEKITHHGKRADGIVKGMLQHSRSSSRQKELTDINALCDEYLRLSYHGLRAKDKTFNAKFETTFDEQVGKIDVVPQEIGRVVLNLINNAFYAVTDKKKTAGEGYDPTVTVSTKKLSNSIEIKVADNGVGIPDAIKEKIFQPFFTTKPTGQGTGLGLSLSYDIITKGHGGEIKLETTEGKGTAFMILLPV